MSGKEKLEKLITHFENSARYKYIAAEIKLDADRRAVRKEAGYKELEDRVSAIYDGLDALAAEESVLRERIVGIEEKKKRLSQQLREIDALRLRYVKQRVHYSVNAIDDELKSDIEMAKRLYEESERN